MVLLFHNAVILNMWMLEIIIFLFLINKNSNPHCKIQIFTEYKYWKQKVKAPHTSPTLRSCCFLRGIFSCLSYAFTNTSIHRATCAYTHTDSHNLITLTAALLSYYKESKLNFYSITIRKDDHQSGVLIHQMLFQ